MNGYVDEVQVCNLSGAHILTEIVAIGQLLFTAVNEYMTALTKSKFENSDGTFSSFPPSKWMTTTGVLRLKEMLAKQST